jgi:hypothetical protein
LLPAFCAEVGLPADAKGFRAALQARLTEQADKSDAGYPDNADLVIDERGRAVLKAYRASPPTATALALEAALGERMPERTLLGSWPGPGTGWSGGTASARPPARTRNWPTRSSATS